MLTHGILYGAEDPNSGWEKNSAWCQKQILSKGLKEYQGAPTTVPSLWLSCLLLHESEGLFSIMTDLFLWNAGSSQAAYLTYSSFRENWPSLKSSLCVCVYIYIFQAFSSPTCIRYTTGPSNSRYCVCEEGINMCLCVCRSEVFMKYVDSGE